MQDFKDINERTLANTFLQLALNHTGQDAYESKVATSIYKVNKSGDMQLLRKEPNDKITTLSWQSDIGQFAKAFKENFSHLNWYKIFEQFSELGSELAPNTQLDKKGYLTLMQLYNKSKPPGIYTPLNLILDKWKSPQL